MYRKNIVFIEFGIIHDFRRPLAVLERPPHKKGSLNILLCSVKGENKKGAPRKALEKMLM